LVVGTVLFTVPLYVDCSNVDVRLLCSIYY
jgi:hypothetical protein